MKNFFNAVKCKYLFLLIVSVVAGCLLTGCGEDEKPVTEKYSADLQEVSVTLYNGETVNVTSSEKIKEIVMVINNASLTKKESVQDVPDADEYGVLTFVSGDDEKVMFYYEKGEKYYIEEPYARIYLCSQNLDEYFGSLKE